MMAPVEEGLNYSRIKSTTVGVGGKELGGSFSGRSLCHRASSTVKIVEIRTSAYVGADLLFVMFDLFWGLIFTVAVVAASQG